MKQPLALLLVAGVAWSSAVTSQTHKQWMDEAQELKEEIGESLEANAVDRAGSSAAKLTRVAEREVRVWKGAEFADIRLLAEENLALARRLTAAVTRRDLAGSRESLHQLEASCRGCHDLHPERRLTKRAAR